MAIKRFLIIDHDKELSATVKAVVKEMGYADIEVTIPGDAAIAKVIEGKVEFLFVNWEGAPMSGEVTTQRLRAIPEGRFLPTVIYTKNLKAEDLRLTRELALNSIMTVPINKTKAVELIVKVVTEEENLDAVSRKAREASGHYFDGETEKALNLLVDCIQKNAKHVGAQTMLAEVLIETRKYEEAENAIKMALDEDPGYVPAKELLAKVYSKTDRHDEAIKMLKKMVDFSPKNISCLLNLGSTYVEADKHDAAKETFEDIATIDPDSPELKDAKGKLAYKEGDLELASQLFANTQHGNELARYFNGIAISLVSSEDFAKGIKTYRDAMKILADKAKLHLLEYNLGLACRKKGDFVEAFKHLACSYIADPSFEKAYAAIARLSTEVKEKGEKLDMELVRKVKEARQKVKK